VSHLPASSSPTVLLAAKRIFCRPTYNCPSSLQHSQSTTDRPSDQLLVCKGDEYRSSFNFSRVLFTKWHGICV